MSVPAPLRTIRATRYVTPLREGGSLPALVEADDDGMYVLKFRGAGQGPRALVAEVVAGGLARAMGLPVPELVLAEVPAALGAAEPDPEIQHLLQASTGLNLGMDFLPSSLPYDPTGGEPLDRDLAAEVVWLDALLTNVDRTFRNPNMLVWHRRLWLIDHGAALYQHHIPGPLAPRADRPFPRIADHVLLPRAGSIAAAAARLAPRVTPAVLDAVLAQVPDDWLTDAASGEGPAARRADYREYLRARVERAAGIAAEAEAARG